jgi:hypothetical protein
MSHHPSETYYIPDMIGLRKALNVRGRGAWSDIVKMPPVTVIDAASPPHTKVVALLRYDLENVYVSLISQPSRNENHCNYILGNVGLKGAKSKSSLHGLPCSRSAKHHLQNKCTTL